MALNADELVVASNGNVYTAPTGSTLPDYISTALDAAWVDLGYTDEDGVQFTASQDSTDVYGWQSFTPLRRILTGKTFEFSFNLHQWNEDTLPFVFGGNTVTEPDSTSQPGEYEFEIPDDAQAEVGLIIEAVDGARNYRIVVPRGTVTDIGAVQLSRSGSSILPVTFAALKDDDAGFTVKIQSDDAAFAV